MTLKKHYLLLMLIAGIFYSCKSSDGPKKARLSNSALGESSMYFSDKDNSFYKSVISSPEIGTDEQSLLEIETGKAIESQQGGAISLPNEAGAQAGTSSSASSSSSSSASSSSSSKPQATVQVTPIDSSQVNTSLYPKCTIARLPVTYSPTVGQTVLLTASCDTDSSKEMIYTWYDEKMQKLGEGRTLSAKESAPGVKLYRIHASYKYSNNTFYGRQESLELTWGHSQSVTLPENITKLIKRNTEEEIVGYSRAYYKEGLPLSCLAYGGISSSKVPLPNNCNAKKWMLSEGGKSLNNSDLSQLKWGRNLLDMESMSNEIFTDMMVTFKVHGSTLLFTDGGVKSKRSPSPSTIQYGTGGPCGFEGYDFQNRVMIGCPGYKTSSGYFINYTKNTSLSNIRILINGVEHKGTDAVVEFVERQYFFKILKALDNKTLIQIAGDDKDGKVVYSNPVLLQYAP